MQWHGVTSLACCSRPCTGLWATKPASKPNCNEPAMRRKPRLLHHCVMGMWIALTLPLPGCGIFGTKPPPPSETRGCFRWIMGNEQEVYVYENGHMLARLDAEAGDVYVKNWCLLKFSEDLSNETRRFLR